MKKIYLVKKDVNKPAGEGNWIEMNPYEFAMFMKTDEGKQRRPGFGQIDACSSDECIIIAECGVDKARKWRAEKDAHDYLKQIEIEMGYTVFSYDEQQSTDDDLNGEELIADDELDVENEVITKITYDELYKAISTLSEYEQDLIQSLFFLKPAMREVDFANKYGFTRRTVGYHKKLILEKLKEVLKF